MGRAAALGISVCAGVQGLHPELPCSFFRVSDPDSQPMNEQQRLLDRDQGSSTKICPHRACELSSKECWDPTDAVLATFQNVKRLLTLSIQTPSPRVGFLVNWNEFGTSPGK